MAPFHPVWDRPIRFMPKDGQDIQYGEPVLDNPSHVNVIAELADAGKLKAKVLAGDSPRSANYSVQLMLRPCPLFDALELNYKTHTDHGEDIQIPSIAQEQCDYEGELVVLIGKDAKNVSENEALDYVAGYTAGNDASAHDWQHGPDKAGPIPQWMFSQFFDKYAPLGLCLVAAHVLGAADSLSLRTLVNGQTLQKGLLIMTGTPGGVGFVYAASGVLKDGDVVEVEIREIGRLRNPVAFNKE
ncbi:hypothetical protein BJX63DRAFT_433548 [Aspergillus granulosus]|uniref:Fumarylacetoacetase-like C-terminal domain-containing protein n=1 Tax=Aspergillus granulosus TaxID=176169 RepID=A0ABR4H8X0_9EURO